MSFEDVRIGKGLSTDAFIRTGLCVDRSLMFVSEKQIKRVKSAEIVQTKTLPGRVIRERERATGKSTLIWLLFRVYLANVPIQRKVYRKPLFAVLALVLTNLFMNDLNVSF